MKLISILNSKTKPEELAMGVVFGMFAGFLMGAPLNLIVIFLILVVINANISMFLFSMLIFKLLAFGVDIAGDKLGYAVLTTGFMKTAGKAMLSMPLVPFTKFNYTVIMGDLIIGIVLIPFLWIGTIKFVDYYRTHIQAKVDKFKVVKMIKMSGFYDTYKSFRGE
jgi:uncharacterized protein (TIGR03546 family)